MKAYAVRCCTDATVLLFLYRYSYLRAESKLLNVNMLSDYTVRIVLSRKLRFIIYYYAMISFRYLKPTWIVADNKIHIIQRYTYYVYIYFDLSAQYFSRI